MWVESWNLHREIARRLRDETSANRTELVCTECCERYDISSRSRRRNLANGSPPKWESCRHPAPEPDAADRRWANAHLDDLARAVAAMTP